MEDTRLIDRFRGCLVGLAVGDALGAPAEFLKEHQVAKAFGVLRDFHDSPEFDAGEFTDDTSMALALAEAIIDAGAVDAEAIAEAFIRWMRTDGRGIGGLTYQALRLIEKGSSPLDAGRLAWETTDRTAAGNGAVMRCAPVGLLDWQDQEMLVEDSLLTSRITHYDPRCCWSCVAVNSAIAAMLRGEEPFAAALNAVQGQCAELEYSLRDSQTDGLDIMGLDGSDMGYTLLTTQAAFAALREHDSFEQGVISVVHKGGDADTNAAVAGALLGARYGLSAIPQRWVDELEGLDRVLAAADGLFELAGEGYWR
jgi:ADP-ribosyl-[dinitrogen reductase] hydrolase